MFSLGKFMQQIVSGGRLILKLIGYQIQQTAFINTWVTLTDGATITPVVTQGNRFTLTAANNNARAFQAPANPVAGDEITIRLVNASGGVLNATTFAAAIKQVAAVTMPANGFNRTYTLTYDGTNWSLISISSADCAN